MSDPYEINVETVAIGRRLSKFVENEMNLGATKSGYCIFAAMGFVAAHYAKQASKAATSPEHAWEIMRIAFEGGYLLFGDITCQRAAATEEPHGAVQE